MVNAPGPHRKFGCTVRLLCRILGTPEGAGSSAAAPLGDTAIWRTADSAPHPGPGPGTRPAAPPSAPGAAAAAAPGPSLNDALALSLGQGSVTLGVAMAGVAVRREHKQLKQQVRAGRGANKRSQPGFRMQGPAM